MTEEQIEAAGIVFSTEVPCEQCESCGDRYFAAEALERFELATASALASMGRRTGSALRFMRKALGFRAKDLAELLDVAPETFSRWETGEREPDAHAFALVGIMAADRLGEREQAETILRAMREPAKVRPSEVILLAKVG